MKSLLLVATALSATPLLAAGAHPVDLLIHEASCTADDPATVPASFGINFSNTKGHEEIWTYDEPGSMGTRYQVERKGDTFTATIFAVTVGAAVKGPEVGALHTPTWNASAAVTYLPNGQVTQYSCQLLNSYFQGGVAP